VELIVQPDDGIEALLTALKNAKETVDIIIFRFDLKPVEKAIHCSDCGGTKKPETYKRGEYCPCCVHHD